MNVSFPTWFDQPCSLPIGRLYRVENNRLLDKIVSGRSGFLFSPNRQIVLSLIAAERLKTLKDWSFMVAAFKQEISCPRLWEQNN